MKGHAEHARISRKILAVLCLLTLLGSASIDIYAASLPTIAAEFGSTVAAAQVTFTFFLGGMVLGQLMWGPMSDRIGRRRVLFLGIGGWIVISLLSAFVMNLEMFIVLRMLGGVFAASGVVTARSIVRDLSPNPSSLASGIGLLSLVSSAAPTLAPIVGAEIAGLWGWRADFLALALIGVTIFTIFGMTVYETVPQDQRASTPIARSITNSLKVAWANHTLRLVSIALGFQAVGFYSYIASMSFLVESQYGHSPSFFALLFGANAASMLVTTLIFRRVSRTVHVSTLMIIGVSVSLTSGLGLILVSTSGFPEWVLWLTTTLFASSIGLTFPAAHTLGQFSGVPGGAASALTGSAQFLGGMMGSPLTGMFGSSVSALGIVIALSAGAALITVLFAKRSLGPLP